ncbi:MAG: hypothetical protein M3128_11205 [Verrucomicrobiota bacterium]|nr:hypothetical protein [Verrucomicrobiota bacterium]
MSRFIRFTFIALALTSCAGSRHLRSTNQSEFIPRYLELADAQSIATFHFPVGLYSLDLVDDNGYYYRAIGRVVKHSFAGPTTQNAGIFVGKRKREVRGYIVWGGARTKIGNLSRARISYRDSITR